jgi:hypothetical protein
MSRSIAMPSPCARDLPALRRAGAELLDVMEALQARGRNVVTELQPADRAMQQWDHYPADDAFDPVSGYRWYYHAHPGPRADQEHGHFHLFAAASTLASTGRYTHLIGLSVSPQGMPLRAFTSNRWVTNEVYAPAGAVLRKLQHFALRAPRELALVHRWLAAVVGLFRPQIGALLVERDERMQRELAQRPNVFEDRRTTVLSQCRLDLAQQMAWLDRVTGQSRSGAPVTGDERNASANRGRPRVRGSIALTGAVPATSGAGEPLRGTRGLHSLPAGRSPVRTVGTSQRSNRNISGVI